LQLLAFKCDGLFLYWQIGMNGLNLSVPPRFFEKDATSEVQKLIKIAQKKEIPVFYPTDFLC
jgi:hypothetical protein